MRAGIDGRHPFFPMTGNGQNGARPFSQRVYEATKIDVEIVPVGTHRPWLQKDRGRRRD